jgi:UDP:flavonoid glycosyltransferase YjiC (YdhE family)
MRTLLIALGSSGDVHPFVGIGLALRQRGHRVTLLTNGHFEPLVRQAGLDFHPVGSAADYERATEDPDLWHPRRGLEVCWRKVFEPAMKPTYDFIAKAAALEKCVVVASPFAFGARLAQEKMGVPLLTAVLQPAMLRTCHGEFDVGGTKIPRWLPMSGRRWLWGMVDRLLLDRLFCPALNGFRRQMGLQPVKNILGGWIHSPDRCIALFPEWFAPPQPDWPRQLVMTGFPLFDEAALRGKPLELGNFLAEGDRPIVFTPGSAMRHARRFFEVSLEACLMLKRRAVFLTPYADQVPARLPPAVRHFDYVPFSFLLDHAAALVHHGGIGTCAQAMKAGIPQLIVPMAFDQFDNASRVEALGLGCSVRPARYTKSVVAERLSQLMQAGSVKARCGEVATRFHNGNPLSDICDLVKEAHPQGMET